MNKFFIVLLGIFILSGCSSNNLEPVTMNLNVDSCDTCHMGIMDLQASAQILLKDGTPKKFDDIGCLVEYMQTNGDNIEAAFVHDHIAGDWIEFSESTFLQNHSLQSPMGYGIIAFGSSEEANDYHKKHAGTIYSHEELLKLEIKDFKKKEPKHGH